MAIAIDKSAGTATYSSGDREYVGSLNLAALMKCEELLEIKLHELEERLSQPSALDISCVIFAAFWAHDDSQFSSIKDASAIFKKLPEAVEFVQALSSAAGIESSEVEGEASSGK